MRKSKAAVSPPPDSKGGEDKPDLRAKCIQFKAALQSFLFSQGVLFNNEDTEKYMKDAKAPLPPVPSRS
jgi:hypothetical protein